MNSEDNKRIVRNYFDLGNRGERQQAASLLCEDFQYRCQGRTPETQVTRTKRELLEAIARGADFWQTPIKITVKGMTAEDDRVAVEAESHGVLRDGTPYDNAYHFLIRMRNGRILSIDEYFCTATFLKTIYAARGTGAGG